MGQGKSFDRVVIVFIFLMAMMLEYREAFSLLEDETLSYRQILRTHFGDEAYTSPSEDVIIVYTDEDFYEEYNKYPLRRADLSTIILRLAGMGAKVIGVDMLLDFNSAYGEDPTLENAFLEAGNVLLVSQAEIEGGEYKGLNTSIERFDKLSENGYSNISANSAISESIVRLRIHKVLYEKYDVWPFAVKAVSMFLEEEPRLETGSLRIGDELAIQLDQFSDMYIDYPMLPGQGDITANLHDVIGISATGLLFPDDDEELEELAYFVRDRIVLIGDVSEVAHDEFETPVGNIYGVEIIANSVATILRNGPLKPASLELELVFAVVLLIVFLSSRAIQDPLPRNVLSIGAILVFVVLTTWLYVAAGLVVSISYLVLAALISLIAINLRFYISEMGQKAMIRDMFGQYLSPKVVEDLVEDPSKIQLGGEEREMTAYFSDVVGFTTISENLSPSELVHLLNDYLTEMCNIIIGYEGTIDKFQGDAIIAFWGAPAVQSDHARRACLASIDMSNRLAELREKWHAEGVPQLKVRMGLNSGPMVVGNMGSVQRLDYTIMGDTVNLTARLEGANKAYGSQMMISESTYSACRDAVDVRELDLLRVVGKTEPVTVYELLDRKNQSTETVADLVAQFEKGLNLYKAGKFGQAKIEFEACLKIVAADGPAQAYIQRCQGYMDNPPDADWDGVFTLTEKG